jgi:hypothetical protein
MRVILDYVFDWLPFGFGVPILIVVGFTLLADEFKAFTATRVCFYLATVWIFGKVVMWGFFTSDRFHIRAVVVFLVFGIVGIGLTEVLRLTTRRETDKNSPPNNQPKSPESTGSGSAVIGTGTIEVKPAEPGAPVIHNRPEPESTESASSKATSPEPANRASNSDNITEEIWFGIHMEASKTIKDDFEALDDKFLKVYRGNGSLNTIDQLPQEYYDKAWEITFGRILICGEENIVSSSMSFIVSEHPQMSVSVSNNAFPKAACAISAITLVQHTGRGLTFEGPNPFPRHQYILEFPVGTRSSFGLRFHMWSEELKQLNQGYLPLWKSFAVDDTSEKIRLEVHRKGPNWISLRRLEQSLPRKILLRTGLSSMGPWIVREYTLTANHPEQFGTGDDASQVIIWAFTWKRTGYAEQLNSFARVDGKMSSGLQTQEERH